ncbi:hypothetical protein CY35_03G112000 [Sphagnum magellanicum]|nr:hypothetical protein CY35_03G112000 [Sphagnum magellanicum]
MVGGITVASGGRGAERIGDLLSLQGRAKRDPEGYEGELLLQLRHFDACLGIFLLQPTTSSSGNAASAASADPGASKELADMAMFLAHMTPLYPQHLGKFPQQLLQLLASHGATLQPALCRQLTQAVILLRNRKMISLVDALPVLMALQCRGDRVLRRLCFLHIVQDIRRMNLKNKNEPSNKPLQTILYNLLQDENDVKAKRALVVLAELNRRKVWVDERTANAICNACFHKVPRIMIAALRFLLGYDQAADDEVEEASSSDDEADMSKPTSTSALSREAVYKAYHKGTTSSRRKKQAKLQRVMRSLQRQQRSKSQALDRQSHAPLYHVHDPQTFAEKLFARLQGCTERFEVKLMMMMAISRAVGIHRLTLLNFYPYLQRYIQPHQRDVTQLLAAAVQACHDLVPPDAVESMIRQLVNQFVHDRARPEVMAVGLNTVREICMRIPLIMTKELLTDLALYKKSREKAVSAAARSIIAVYRQVWPALLEKKDRGRGADLTAHPKAYGEAVVSTGIPGAELLLEEDVDSEEEGSDKEDEEGEEDNDEEGVDILSEDGEMGSDADLIDSDEDLEGSEDNSDNSDGDEESDDEEVEEMQDNGGLQKRKFESEDGEDLEEVSRKKQKTVGGVTEAGSTEQSLRNLKKIVAAKAEYKLESEILSRDGDGILSNEDFERIRELQAKKAARSAMAEHGMTKAGKNRREVTIKLGRNENLGEKRVNPAHLEARIHKRREKEERVASARAGREDRPQFGARTAIKQKKTGGTSNRQKEKSKGMPLAAKRAIVARTKQQRRIKGKSANKQFRGKKAWK